MSQEVANLNAEVGALRSENRDPSFDCTARRNSSRAELDAVPRTFELADREKIE